MTCRSGGARYISIHALREEGDVSSHGSASQLLVFQSTPSARRATLGVHHTTIYRELFQSTPSARRATLHFTACTVSAW